MKAPASPRVRKLWFIDELAGTVQKYLLLVLRERRDEVSKASQVCRRDRDAHEHFAKQLGHGGRQAECGKAAGFDVLFEGREQAFIRQATPHERPPGWQWRSALDEGADSFRGEHRRRLGPLQRPTQVEERRLKVLLEAVATCIREEVVERWAVGRPQQGEEMHRLIYLRRRSGFEQLFKAVVQHRLECSRSVE